MNKKLIRVVGSVLMAALLVCSGAWVSGFDFDHRGGDTFILFCMWLGACVVFWTCPNWDE